jgi:beta-galactosidase
MGPNPTYEEAMTIGRDFARLSPKLINMKQKNRAALLVSNEALTALQWFPLPGGKTEYNDIVRLIYDRLYEMNIGCDILSPDSDAHDQYDLIVVPTLYAASDETLDRLNRYVKNGGHVIYTFKSGFANEHIKVRTDVQPGRIGEVCGIRYSQFVKPNKVMFKGDPFEVGVEHNNVEVWMELLTLTTAEALAWYDHPHWGAYAAVTENRYGNGTATYIGCIPSAQVMGKVIERACKAAGLWGPDQDLRFPLIMKSGTNEAGQKIRYFLNYSNESISFRYSYEDGTELLSGRKVCKEEQIELDRWGIAIVEAVTA